MSSSLDDGNRLRTLTQHFRLEECGLYVILGKLQRWLLAGDNTELGK
jgi:hypothetical protein